MKSDFDKFAEEIQGDIIDNARKRYSEIVIDHWLHPRNFGKLEKADAYGRITGPCGDTMEIFLYIKDNKIVDCHFLSDGCGTSVVCGSIVTELAKGKTIKEAKEISKGSVLKACGGLPKEDEHCALLASNTLIEAIENYEDQN